MIFPPKNSFGFFFRKPLVWSLCRDIFRDIMQWEAWTF